MSNYYADRENSPSAVLREYAQAIIAEGNAVGWWEYPGPSQELLARTVELLGLADSTD